MTDDDRQDLRQLRARLADALWSYDLGLEGSEREMAEAIRAAIDWLDHGGESGDLEP